MQYSHSRLGTFEQCKQKFKFRYIDKTESDIDNTIEAFMGSRVHEALEKLYKELKLEKMNSVKDLMDFYNQEWKRHWTEGILIVREGFDEEHYRKLGERCIREYYERFKPFDGARVIATELRVEIDVEGRTVQGFIDRLDCQGTHYFIHDYKTSASLPAQADLDGDRQLALYSIAVKEMYSDAEQITLVWHFLQFDKTFTSSRTTEQLDSLRKGILEVIKEVEVCAAYPPQPSKLCDWCEYRSQCPAWKHEVTVESLSVEDFKADDGVRLVDEYQRLNDDAKAVEVTLEAAKQRLVNFAAQHSLTQVAGSRMRAKIWSGSNLAFPGKRDPGRQEFEELLKKLGIYDQAHAVDTWYLGDLMKEGRIDPVVAQALLKKYPKKDVTKIYLSVR